ncbi:hypothetical protein CEQ31_014795 [Serratia odorifera]|uniref:Uncharacterized protein n=1 Tax=Serratia odorifera DSM 4582 TaxID=667129 RepID=D4E1Q1_SEROD|nr:hypothetical protein HMPREF0758_2101 [Serratia odorifera DSM 4582]PNK90857.1 hypothetical protein CEQ31_014795 [Serratia odorifera]RII71855.1 hypothetical protein DX901_11555 [Serratia odorifera]
MNGHQATIGNWDRQRPIGISKIRALALFLIMPNSEHRLALPHIKMARSGEWRSVKRTAAGRHL